MHTPSANSILTGLADKSPMHSNATPNSGNRLSVVLLFVGGCILCRLGAHYDIEGVADSAVLVLAKFTSTLNPSIPKPRLAFGRDHLACAAVEAMLQMVNRQVEALAKDGHSESAGCLLFAC
jgi:hypothetical protein